MHRPKSSSRIPDGLGEEHSLFRAQFEFLGRVLPVAVVKPRGQSLRSREQEYVCGNETVQIPQEALALAGLDDQSDSERARLLVALELFREERVSLGRAAELAGLSIEEFMEFSAQRQVPSHYSDDDLVEDRTTAARLNL